MNDSIFGGNWWGSLFVIKSFACGIRFANYITYNYINRFKVIKKNFKFLQSLMKSNKPWRFSSILEEIESL